jgi:hypothetical protein
MRKEIPLDLKRWRQTAMGLPSKAIGRRSVIMLSVWLTGCAAQMAETPPPSEMAAATEQSEAMEDIPPAAEPATATAVPAPDPKPRPESDSATNDATTRVAALPPPLPPGYLSGRLVGLGFAAMRTQLGEPNEIRDAAPAQEWVYKDDACLLTVRFFPEGASLLYKALSVNVRSESSKDGEDARCPQLFAKRLQPQQ